MRSPQDTMTTSEVESLARDVIVHMGLPFTVLSVIGSPTGWNIMVRSSGTGVLRFTLNNASAVIMRRTIQETLEAHL